MRFFKKNSAQNLHIEHQHEQLHVLSFDLKQNMQVLQTVYDNCIDVVFRSFQIGGTTNAALIYIDGLVNIEELDSIVLPSLMKHPFSNISIDIDRLLEQTLTVSKTKKNTNDRRMYRAYFFWQRCFAY